MMTARSDAGTGSGLQVGSFLIKMKVAKPAAEFHEPGESEMDDETTQDGAGIGGDYAEDKTAEEGGDAFTQGFAKVDGAIEGGHGQGGVLADEAKEAYDEEAAEEELYAEEVEAVRELV